MEEESGGVGGGEKRMREPQLARGEVGVSLEADAAEAPAAKKRSRWGQAAPPPVASNFPATEEGSAASEEPVPRKSRWNQTPALVDPSPASSTSDGASERKSRWGSEKKSSRGKASEASSEGTGGRKSRWGSDTKPAGGPAGVNAVDLMNRLVASGMNPMAAALAANQMQQQAALNPLLLQMNPMLAGASTAVHIIHVIWF